MKTAKVFKSGKSQAVRLPKRFQFESKEVHVKRVGRNVILRAKDDLWQSLCECLDMFSPDFMAERRQPLLEKGVLHDRTTGAGKNFKIQSVLRFIVFSPLTRN